MEMSKGIQILFSEIANTYECINTFLTFGLDSSWRKKAVEVATKDGGQMWLDVCSGTGDMAALLSKYANDDTKVFSADFSLPMINKAREKKTLNCIYFMVAEASQLPFPDDTFDLVTISFATRSINDNREKLLKCFTEFHRILKPNGRFVNIETSQPQFEPIKKLFHLYLKFIVKPWGKVISGSKTSYICLSNTASKFYDADELSQVIHQAGFSKVEYERLSLGIAAIHKAVKAEN